MKKSKITSLPYHITNAGITAYFPGEGPKSIDTTHPNYEKVRQALIDKDWDDINILMDLPKAVAAYSGGRVKVKDGEVLFNGEAVHNALTSRILRMMQDGFDIAPMAKFLDNLMDNPSKRSVQELYSFLEKNDLPITEDGCFLAYKYVNDNYKDSHTNTIDNRVGRIVEMPRNKVDDNRDNTCSTGLHFCSHEYLPNYGSGSHSTVHIMVLKINPRDVVSIPSDYNNAKGRCCRYEVIDEHKAEGDTLGKKAVYYDDVVDDGVCDCCGEEYRYCDCDSCDYPDDPY